MAEGLWGEAMNKPSSPEEFFRQYCEVSGLSVEEALRNGRIAGPCNCDYEGCEGFGMYRSQELLDEWVEMNGGEEKGQWPARKP